MWDHKPSWFEPNWSRPDRVRCVQTTAFSPMAMSEPYGFNLANHVGDDPQQVSLNRQALKQIATLPDEPVWLHQTHSIDVLNAPQAFVAGVPSADGCITSQYDQVLVVMTADCLPILLCDEAGQWVGAVHAGWRGLVNGIVVQAVQQMQANTSARLLAYIGPAISQQAFEVGAEVRAAFVAQATGFESFFALNTQSQREKYGFDLAGAAQWQLQTLGVRVTNSHLCSATTQTSAGESVFFSYRRQSITGRMASLIWLG